MGAVAQGLKEDDFYQSLAKKSLKEYDEFLALAKMYMKEVHKACYE